MEEEKLVTIENQFGVRHTVTESQWIRLKGNPTNPLTLVVEKSPNGKKPIKELPIEMPLPVAPEPEEISEVMVSPEPPPKRGRGRPKGSKSNLKEKFQKKHIYKVPRKKKKKNSKAPNVGRKTPSRKSLAEKKLLGFETRT